MGEGAKAGQADDPVEVVLPLDTAPGAVARIRRVVAQQCAQHGLIEIANDVQLVASELATNALLYAGPPAELVLHFMPSRARLEVRDGNPVPPVRSRPGSDAMTGRGLHLVDALTREWGVIARDSGKAVWAELEVGADAHVVAHDDAALIAMWVAEELGPAGSSTEEMYTVHLGHVPTDLLLSAKSHVENLVREFVLAAAGERTGTTAPVPVPIAELLETVVSRFADARQAIKHQALVAADAGESHVNLELTLPASAADAAGEYLRAIDEADAYCRAARLLTLESSPQHRVFRHWYVEELIDQLRHSAEGRPAVLGETFEQRLLREIDAVAIAERQSERAVRLHTLTVALAAAATPAAVADAVLREGVAALAAAGGGVLLATDSPTLAVPGTVGYDDDVVARLRAESREAELPAAAAVRSGNAVWLESRAERDARFPELVGLEPATISMCAVPLIVEGRCLGALRFSFNQTRLFDAAERSFLEALAAQTAQALDRAQLYERRVDVARRLQRSLLPPQLSTIPGVAVRAAYHPVTAAMEVGGDFYDVWPCGPRRWAVAIGDVCGTGPEAAATTALVRHTLRALTLGSSDIEAILGDLNDALADAAIETPNERFSTVLFGILTTESDDCWIDLVSGGHVGPIIVRADGSVEVLEFTGSLLGILEDVEFDRRRIHLDPGDEVVLVTDGVTEARSGSSMFGIGGVADVVAAARERQADTAAAIERAVSDFGGSGMQDDLVVLALRRDDR